MNTPPRARPAILAVLLLTSAFGSGCQKKEAPAPPVPIAKSLIEAKTTLEGVSVRTPSTDFLLTPAGKLTASLRTQNASLSLDAGSLDAAQTVTIDKKEYSSVLLDTAHAVIREVAGTGNKYIEVSGKIWVGPRRDLLEVYTIDLPCSLSLRNAGQSDVALNLSPPAPLLDASARRSRVSLTTFDPSRFQLEVGRG